MDHDASSHVSSKMEKLLPTTSAAREKPRNDEPFWFGLSRKQLSLIVLTLQNASLGLVMRHSRLPHDYLSREQPLYVPSTAVFLAEIVKFLTCLLAIGHLKRWSLSRFKSTIYREVFQEPGEVLKMAIPSALYAAQNNLLYIALSNLDATTFQITYQLKILTTALFSVVLLRRKLAKHKWVALLFLMTGVALVQLQTARSPANDIVSHSGLRQSPSIGFVAVLTATVSSGFSGCYFEMLLKSGGTNMWIRNLQLGLSALLFSATAMFLRDWAAIRARGLLAGYDPVVWAVVMNQAIGGLLVAIVVKYADNILKTFSTALAIIVSAVASVYFFSFQPSISFVVGAIVVMLSTYMFALTGCGWTGLGHQAGASSSGLMPEAASHKARLSVPYIPQMRVQPPTPDPKRAQTSSIDSASISSVSPRLEQSGDVQKGNRDNGRMHSSPLKSQGMVAVEDIFD